MEHRVQLPSRSAPRALLIVAALSGCATAVHSAPPPIDDRGGVDAAIGVDALAAPAAPDALAAPDAPAAPDVIVARDAPVAPDAPVVADAATLDAAGVLLPETHRESGRAVVGLLWTNPSEPWWLDEQLAPFTM